jgi:hypothetical protein
MKIPIIPVNALLNISISLTSQNIPRCVAELLLNKGLLLLDVIIEPPVGMPPEEAVDVLIAGSAIFGQSLRKQFPCLLFRLLPSMALLRTESALLCVCVFVCSVQNDCLMIGKLISVINQIDTFERKATVEVKDSV